LSRTAAATHWCRRRPERPERVYLMQLTDNGNPLGWFSVNNNWGVWNPNESDAAPLQPFVDKSGKIHYELMATPPSWMGVSLNDYVGFYSSYGSSGTFVVANGYLYCPDDTPGAPRLSYNPEDSDPYLFFYNGDGYRPLTVTFIPLP
jgi:hypothetical protein